MILEKTALLTKINNRLTKLISLSPSSTQTSLDSDPDGHFRLQLSKGSSMCLVAHNGTYENPGTIDIVLFDKTTGDSYVIYMTECEIQDFPSLLDDAYRIVMDYINSKYSIKKFKSLGLFKQEYLKFTNPKITYNEASKTKRKYSQDDLFNKQLETRSN